MRHCLQDLSRTSWAICQSNSAAPRSEDDRQPMRTDLNAAARVLRRAGAPPRCQSVKGVQTCDIACKTFCARHWTTFPVRTVLPQCRWEDRQPVRTNLNAAVARVLQARRRTATLPKCQRWCKSATLHARPFAHVTGHLPTATVLPQCGGKVANPVRTGSERSRGTRAAGVQAHRDAAKVSKVVQKRGIACKTFRARHWATCPVRTVLPQGRRIARSPDQCGRI